ncbi:MAG TPA: acylphosphatase [Candidatus Nanoarchaeia archaeon]|nr:acylphosphatase [Candidatus Nanoarchaeia archaeon]
MKKTLRIYLTGSVQGMFFRQFVKDAADKHNVRGFVRKLEDLRMEIFLEGDSQNVEVVAAIVKAGPKHAVIRSVEEKEERYQEFKDFKILNF